MSIIIVMDIDHVYLILILIASFELYVSYINNICCIYFNRVMRD